jgi:hypothetical protein
MNGADESDCPSRNGGNDHVLVEAKEDRAEQHHAEQVVQ